MIKLSKLTFLDILQLMFIYLKLSGQINWSWIGVLSPLILCIFLAIIIGICKGAKVYWNEYKEDIGYFDFADDDLVTQEREDTKNEL